MRGGYQKVAFRRRPGLILDDLVKKRGTQALFQLLDAYAVVVLAWGIGEAVTAGDRLWLAFDRKLENEVLAGEKRRQFEAAVFGLEVK